MKYLKFVLLIVLLNVFSAACSRISTAGMSKSNDSNNTSAAASPRTNSSEATTSSPGEAHFSCTIDGQQVSGGAIDKLQEFNTAFITDVSQGKELLFYLTDSKGPETTVNPPHKLRFAVPDKTGSSSFGPDEDGWGIEVDINADKDHPATYFSDSFTIDVTTLSSTRVAGTFSGKFRLREGALSQNAKKEIEVKDGKFDIPFSTGNMRPT